MRNTARLIAACATTGCLFALTAEARAQSLDAIGTRAQGMAGAFVGVADDASAVYWNPAGLAGGAYFSLVLDGNTAEAIPDDAARGGSRSGWLLALTTPALGLSYARLQATTVRPASGLPEASHLESLVTQHVGVTLVHSITERIAVGSTLKFVRGTAAAADVLGNDREELLDHADLIGHATNRGDLDIGVMATGTYFKTGLTIRNVTAPNFGTGSGQELELQRQVRAGTSILLLPKWTLAGGCGLPQDRRGVRGGSRARVRHRRQGRGACHGPCRAPFQHRRRLPRQLSPSAAVSRSSARSRSMASTPVVPIKPFRAGG